MQTGGKTLREIKDNWSKSWLSLEPRASPCGSNGKELACRAGDTRDVSSIPGSGKFPGKGNGNPLHYSCMRNPMDKGAWQTAVRVHKRVGHNWLSMHAQELTLQPERSQGQCWARISTATRLTKAKSWEQGHAHPQKDHWVTVKAQNGALSNSTSNEP